MRKMVFLPLLVLLTVFLVQYTIQAQDSGEEEDAMTGFFDLGMTHEVIRSGDTFQGRFYGYQKYYINDSTGNWNFLNESYSNEGCDINYNYCVDRNLYQVHIKEYPDTAESVLYRTNGSAFKFQPFTLNWRNALDQLEQIATIQHVKVEMRDNQAVYPDAFIPEVNLTYDYLPRTLKEGLVVNDTETLPTPAQYILDQENVTLDLDFLIAFDSDIDIYIENVLWDKKTTAKTKNAVVFKRGERTLFQMPKPVAFDAEYQSVGLEYEFKKQGNNLYVVLKTSYLWLINETRVYPVNIDPPVEFVSLGFADIISDIHIVWFSAPICPIGEDCPDYMRVNEQALQVGRSKTTASENQWRYRTMLEWNVSTIPQIAVITNMNLTLFKEARGSVRNRNQSIVSMVGNSTIYNTNTTGAYDIDNAEAVCEGPGTGAGFQGNCHYFNDASYINFTGIRYNNSFRINSTNDIYHVINVTDGKEDLMNILATGRIWWGLGIASNRGETSTANGQVTSKYSSSEDAEPARRPVLVVDFRVDFYNCSRNIVLNQPLNSQNQNISIKGGGTFTIKDVNVFNWTGMNIQGKSATDRCVVTCSGGCFKR